MKHEPKETDLDRVGSIITTMKLETIQLKDLRWKCKMCVNGTLPKAYRSYKVELVLDEEPYLKRIEEVQVEFDTSLFSTNAVERKINDKKVDALKKQLAKMKSETEEIKFVALVEELKYRDGDTVLLMNIPDDIIEAFNRQKTRFDIYQLTLVPIL